MGFTIEHARLQPFLDETNHSIVPDFPLDETNQIFVVYGIEEAANIRIKHPAHFLSGYPDAYRIERLVLPSSGPESV
jgi:hypothetical protein